MPQDYHTPQEYSFHDTMVHVASVADDHLCRVSTSHFIAILLCIAAVLSFWTAAVAYQMGGAEEVVYRRHAEVRALASVHAGWER